MFNFMIYTMDEVVKKSNFTQDDWLANSHLKHIFTKSEGLEEIEWEDVDWIHLA
jgi:hypothetical protein